MGEKLGEAVNEPVLDGVRDLDTAAVPVALNESAALPDLDGEGVTVRDKVADIDGTTRVAEAEDVREVDAVTDDAGDGDTVLEEDGDGDGISYSQMYG